MGTYNSIKMRCSCGEVIHIQSKSGDCKMRVCEIEAPQWSFNTSAARVPTADVVGFEGTYTCSRCGAEYEVKGPPVITMMIVKVKSAYKGNVGAD